MTLPHRVLVTAVATAALAVVGAGAADASSLKAPTTHKPTISGVAEVGHRLTAVPGTWKPSGEKLSYRWYAAGKAISGATAKSYTITSARVGQRLTVHVTGTKKGYRTVSVASAATTPVVPPMAHVADPQLRVCLDDALKIPEGTDPTQAQVASLTAIDCSDQGITTLAGLQYATHATTVFLSGNLITDPSPVSHLPNTWDLHLDHDPISDVSSLAAIPHPQVLWLDDDKILDISPLHAMIASGDVADLRLSDQYLTLPSTTVGAAGTPLPVPRDENGSPIARTFDEISAPGTVTNNAVTWTAVRYGYGIIDWTHDVLLDEGVNGTLKVAFSGNIVQPVTAAP